MRDSLIIAGVFGLARVVCWWLGIGFDFDNLGTWWQIDDPMLLRERLWSTVFYTHAQPPLFNLLIGVALQAGDGWFPVVMAWVYGAVSLVGILCLHGFGRAVLRARWVSLVVALWFCVSPDVLLFNEKLFYDGLVPWLLCVGLFGVWAGLRGRPGWLVLGFGALASVVLLRSMFHPLWFVVVVGLVFWLSGWRWRVLAGAAGPTAAVGAVLAKNLVVFGFIGLSSWAPLNLVGVTVEKLPAEERAAMVADGRLSALSAIDAFGPIDRLVGLLAQIGVAVPVMDEPVLDAATKSDGRPNMNHMAMLIASRMRGGDALAAVRADPVSYVAVLLTSMYHFHRPANEFRDVRRNLAAIAGWARWSNAVVGLQPAAWFGSSLDATRPGWFWLQISVGSVLISLAFMAALVRVGRMARRGVLTAEAVVLAAMIWTGGFVAVISTALDVLENNRARYTVAPLLTLAAVWFVVDWVRKIRPSPRQ